MIIQIPAAYSTSPSGVPILVTAASMIIRWTTISGKYYQLQSSTDLTSAHWSNFGSPTYADGNPISENIQTTPSAATPPQACFWRVTISDVDSDNDSLTNAEELSLGSDTFKRDTDSDGVADWAEVATYSSSPTTATDSDADTLPDVFERDFATKLLQAHPASSHWGNKYAGLVAGNLDATYDYTGDGVSLKEFFTAFSNGASTDPLTTSHLIQAETRHVNVTGRFVPAFENNPERSDFYGTVWTQAIPYPAGYTIPLTRASATAGFLASAINNSGWYSHTWPVSFSYELYPLSLSCFSSFWSDHSSNGSYQCSGEYVQQRHRICATKHTHPAASFSFLKVTRQSNNNDPSAIISVESVTHELAADRMLTQWINVDVTMGTQQDLLPVEVSWKAIEGVDNVDDHIDPWNKPIYGKRIFPDFKNPNESEIQHKLEVIVKTSSALFGKTVYVKAFDVDDSTSEEFDHDENGTTPVIDTNGKAGNDNLVDYLNTPQNGQFWTGSAWGGQTAQGTVDANGEMKFIFRVGMQPGSNYRVVVSVIDESMYANVQTSSPDAPNYLGPETTQNGGCLASPLLTVWRRLWVENDSMAAIPTDTIGYKKNDLHASNPNPTVGNGVINSAETETTFPISEVSDQSSFFNLENGHIFLRGVTHDVVGTIVTGGIDYVRISGNHTLITSGSGLRLYDDDDYGLNRAPLPRNDLVDDTFKNVYKPAFIEVVDAANFKGQDYNPSKTVDFYRNHPVMVGPQGFQSPSVWDDAINLTDSKPLWVGNLIAGYQGNVGDDRDPSSEGLMEGITPGSRRYSIVYVENVRDQNDAVIRNASADNTAMNSEIARNIKLTAAHEIGHMPRGGDETSHHAENMLMDEDGYGSDNGLKFSPKSILRFRKTNQWQQP